MLTVGKRTAHKLGLVVVVIACLMHASDDWLMGTVSRPPSLTLGAIVCDWFLLVLVNIVLAAPITLVLWNFVVSPTFEVRRIRYIEALVLTGLMCWFVYS